MTRTNMMICAMDHAYWAQFDRLRCELLWVQDKALDPGHDRHVQQQPDTLSAWLVRAGRAEVATAAGTVAALPGQWLVLRPVPRRQRFARGTQLRSILFRCLWPERPWWDAGASAVGFVHPPLSRLADVLTASVTSACGGPLRFDERLAERPVDLAGHIQVRGHFHAWLACLVEQMAGQGLPAPARMVRDARVVRALENLERDPWGIDPVGLARGVGLQRRRLEQLFREDCGHGVAAERTRRQLNLVMEQLVQADEPIKAIAHRLGFAGADSLSSWFRRHAGCSPRTWRKRGPV